MDRTIVDYQEDRLAEKLQKILVISLEDGRVPTLRPGMELK